MALISVISLLCLWEVVPVPWENLVCRIMFVLFQKEIYLGLGVSWAIAQFP
jgi:hypothetical protein